MEKKSLSIYARRLKHNREKGIPDYKYWYKISISDVILKPDSGESYQHYIERISIERPNCPPPFKENGYKWENHHIVPLCMGGSDTDDNKIWLTVQEHYWAHKLLCQEHEDNPDLIKSFNLVLHRLGYGIITQEDIDFINKILKVTLPSGVQKIEETLIE